MVLAATAGLGCGGEQAPAPQASQAPKVGTYQSGSRLHAEAWVPEQGDVPLFISWRDTALDERCELQRLVGEAGLRCVPHAGADSIFTGFVNQAWGSSGPRNLFADATCTEPVVAVAQAVAVPRHVTLGVDESCSGDRGSVEVLALADAPLPGTEVYARDPVTNACTLTPLFATGRAFRSSPAPATDFVGATIAIEPRGDALGVELLVAEDGARQVVRAFDRRRALPCSASPVQPDAVDLDARCLPVNLAVKSTSFDDPVCNPIPLAYTCKAPSCADPTFAIFPVGDACPAPEYEVRSLGPPGASKSTPKDGGCVNEDAAFETCPYYQAKETVPIDVFPAVRVTTVGGGRLLLPVLEAAGDPGVLAPFDQGFWDRERRAICAPQRFADGIDRCVPIRSARPVIVGYADLVCTKPLVAADGCVTAPYVLFNGDPPGLITPAPITEVHEVTPFTGAQMYTVQQGACVGGPAQEGLWQVGSAHPADSVFSRVKQVTE